MNKPYRKVNLSCFIPYGTSEPEIVDSSSDLHTLNWSSIQTKLIQLAGRLCNSYASDVVISINSIQCKINEGKLENGNSFLFGFREMGVDHNSFVENCTEGELDRRYREIWKIEVNIGKIEGYSFNQFQFKLYRVEYNSYANKNEE